MAMLVPVITHNSQTLTINLNNNNTIQTVVNNYCTTLYLQPSNYMCFTINLYGVENTYDNPALNFSQIVGNLRNNSLNINLQNLRMYVSNK